MVVAYIVAPKADDARSGWRVRYSAPRQAGLRKHYRDIVPATAQMPLPATYGAMSAFAAWDVAKTGHYRIRLGGKGTGGLARRDPLK